MDRIQERRLFGRCCSRAPLTIHTGSGSVAGGYERSSGDDLTILVITDLTAGTGRFNLVRGFVGTAIAIAASISTGATGFIFQGLGHLPGFLILTGAGLAATCLLWIAMPETKPAKYID
jgi:hypothetical protein